MVLLQQPVNCIVRLVDHGVMEKPEFDIASQIISSREPAAKRGNKVQGRQPQDEPLELAWRHISKSWLGPSLHSGGVRTIHCFFFLCAASRGFSAHGSNAMSCLHLRGLGEK